MSTRARPGHRGVTEHVTDALSVVHCDRCQGNSPPPGFTLELSTDATLETLRSGLQVVPRLAADRMASGALSTGRPGGPTWLRFTKPTATQVIPLQPFPRAVTQLSCDA